MSRLIEHGTGGRRLSKADREALRLGFLGWQCRLRQIAMRNAEGRPSPGMVPQVWLADGEQPLGRVVVLLVKEEAEEFAAEFRFMHKKTHDPVERQRNVLRKLQELYYQKPQTFSDEMTALFALDSDLAATLLGAGQCILDFEQFSQRFRLPCAVRLLDEQEPAFQASYWHNSLFNPSLPGRVQILGFAPDWGMSVAEPPLE